MYRRPLTTDELGGLMALYDARIARVAAADPAAPVDNKDVERALKTVIARMLNSPEFLYHVEVGDEQGALTPHEFVRRLSYFAWETTPSPAMLDAAEAGDLDTPAGRALLVEQALEDPRAVRTMVRFFELWLGLEKLSKSSKSNTVHPEFKDLKKVFDDEFRQHVAALIQRNAPLSELFVSTKTMANHTLREFYGVDHPDGAQPGDDDTYLEVDLGPRHKGILSRGAFLSITGKTERSAPILRGVFVREHLLCSPLGSPPPGADAQRPTRDANLLTDREFWSDSTEGATCQGCHDQINPIGFTFENFDAIGGWRDMDRGKVVDASGALTGLGAPQPVDDYSGLVDKLGQSSKVNECMMRFWFRSRVRRYETRQEEAMILQWVESMQTQGGDVRLKDMTRAIATSAFFNRAGLSILRAP